MTKASSQVNNEGKQPRTIQLRYVVIISLILVAVTSFLISGLLIGGLLFGKSLQGTSTEQQRQTIIQEGDVIADVAEEVGGSVVSIVTKQGGQEGFRTSQSQGAGTGVIIDANGLILTNKHVVPENTSAIQIHTQEGDVYDDVQVVGRDPLNDLAILKVNNHKNFIAARLADSDVVRPGQKVIAIGNALGQFQNTVTSGIISGIGRPVSAGDSNGMNVEQLTNLFQTDAAINSGNSGGPLLNFNGEVIGINTAIAANAQNIGFAIPINEAKGIIDSVQKTGKLTRPYLGVRYLPITPNVATQLNLPVKEGAYILDETDAVIRGGPADKAGLRPADIITAVDDIILNEKVSLTSAVGRYQVGDTVVLKVLRGSEELTITVKLEEI